MSSRVQESASSTSSETELGTTQNETVVAAVTDSDSDNETSVADKDRPTFALKMLNLCKELILMVVIAVAYAALTNESPPKVSKSPSAYPFFPRNSLITDWYKGQITEAIEEARSSDIAFVMFYAPWDAESQLARKELEATANYMHKKVTFAAVNCWQPGSECKRQYSKVYKWPVLIAYPTHGRGIQYNGPLEAFHMIKFLQNVCKPIIKPDRVDDLMGKYDTIILAKINVLPGSYEYAVFYSTALRFLERDPFRETAVFAVLPQKYDAVPNVQIYNWNGTIRYDGEWNPESLSAWVVKNTHQITRWLSPTGMKSLNFAGFMQPGPALLLFTPKNPLLEETDYYDMLREVAYEYYNCANQSSLSTKLMLVTEKRSRNRISLQQLKENCLEEQNSPKPVLTTSSNIWSNTSIRDICNCIHTACPKNDVSDYLSPISLQKIVKDETCGNFALAQKYSPSIFERSRDVNKDVINVTGLACASNVSLKMLAVDSLRYHQFAARLGVDLSKSIDKSGVVIVNEKLETHHVMTTNLDWSNLRHFVYNFTQKTLARSLRSKVYVKTKYNHFYPHWDCAKSEKFCVLELTSTSFLPTIHRTNKVVIVFYYSKQCSFCNGIAYIFLTVAKMLAALSDEILFARIDGESNLLPWEYTMESYPTILFFPANQKSESRAFPRNIPITVPNLLGFILTNVRPILKLKTMWTICCQTKFPDEKERCMASVRMETLTIIGKTLREWRISSRKRKVLYKLQMLRHLHLLFAHSPNEILQIHSYLNKL